MLEAVDRDHFVLDPLGNVRLDLFGTGAGIDRHDRDERRVHLRHKLQTHLACGVEPEQGQTDDQAAHRHRSADGGIGQKHQFSS